MQKLISLFGIFIAIISCTSAKETQTDTYSQEGISEGITKLTFGKTIFYTLKDHKGERLQPNSRFYGENDRKKVDKLSPNGVVESSIHSFLMEKNGKKALFDTGLGENGRLWEHLKTLSISPSDIDIIFLTHLHGDHIGGMLNNNEKMFPNAKIFVSQMEYNYWIQKTDTPAYKTLKAYEPQLEKFSITQKLPLGVQPLEAYGHTPGHTVFEVGKLLIVGDILHGAELQLKDLNLCASYDMNKEQSILSRKKVLDYAKKNNKIIAGMHLPKNGIIQP